MKNIRSIGKSIGAVLAGIIAGAVLSLGTDMVFHTTGTYPPWGQTMSDGLFLLATAYRIVYSVAGCYLVAWLAPDRPMLHAMVGGGIGLVVSLVGAVVTWNKGLGPHWYPLAVAAISVPCAWVGGKFRELQLLSL